MSTDLLNIGKSGLFSAKQSMSTTSHNIANANTDGFSKQDVKTVNGITISHGNYVLGTGVDIKSVKRSHDEMVEKKLNHSITGHKFNEERTVQLTNIEDLFNEINSEGLNKIMNRFFNFFRELSTQPESETLRSIVKENAKLVVNDFNRIQNELDTIKTNIDKKISYSIEEINSLASTVGKLNKEIAVEEVTGSTANDLRDQRDRAIRSLSEFLPLVTYVDSQGQLVINVDGVGSLVSGVMVQELKAGSTLKSGGTTADRGSTEIFFASRPSTPITDKIKTGALGAQIKTRDTEVKEFEKQLDELAYTLVMSTNAIHRKGYANHQVPTDESGNPLPHLSEKKVTGINFFKEPINLDRAAEYISLSKEVEDDPNNIATAVLPNTPGDNRIALAISKLQYEKIMNGEKSSFEEHYLKSVGDIGLKSAKSKIDEEQSQGILAQAKSFKEKISGVSLDEEAANMVRYQNVYESSAKIIKAADDMFKLVVGLIR